MEGGAVCAGKKNEKEEKKEGETSRCLRIQSSESKSMKVK